MSLHCSVIPKARRFLSGRGISQRDPSPAARRARDDTGALVVESAPLSPSWFKERFMRQRFARLGILFLMLAGTWLAGGSAAAQQPRPDSVLARVGGRRSDGFGGPPLGKS